MPDGPARAAAVADVQVIVPVKRLTEAKSRLRSCLGDAEREALVLDMLGHVLSAARAASRVAAVCVVTPDPEIARHAHARGARAVRDEGFGLNAGLRGALHDPAITAASAWLVLPADLPQINAEAIDRMLAKADTARHLAIAPDQHLTGTSALAWRGAAFDGFHFGPHSFAAHQRAGRDAGFTVAALPACPELFDVDDAGDLSRLRRPSAASPFRNAAAHA
jgi:2-phospho-L-lactate guanylyltransferase